MRVLHLLGIVCQIPLLFWGGPKGPLIDVGDGSAAVGWSVFTNPSRKQAGREKCLERGSLENSTGKSLVEPLPVEGRIWGGAVSQQDIHFHFCVWHVYFLTRIDILKYQIGWFPNLTLKNYQVLAEEGPQVSWLVKKSQSFWLWADRKEQVG